MSKRWTPEEDSYLKEIYENNSKEFILSKIQKSWLPICDRARRLNLHRNPIKINEDRKIRGIRSDAWTQNEEDILKEIYENNYKEFILSKIDRTWQSLLNRAHSLNLHRNPDILKQEMIEGGKTAPIREDFWAQTEDDLLKQIYVNNYKKIIITKFPNRTWKAIRERSTKLGLIRNRELINEEIMSGNKKTIKERYGVEYSTQLSKMKEKSRQTNIERLGVEYPSQSGYIKEKIKETVQAKYRVDNVFQSKEIQERSKQSFYKNGTQKCSKQQKYLSDILNGEINFPVGDCNIDILIDEKIILEYDGGGHKLGIKLGSTSQEEFDSQERKRELFLKSKGYSIIRIISEQDYLPEDSIIIKMIIEAKNYLLTGHSWITFNIDNKKVKCSKYEDGYDFGKLRKI